MVEVRYTSGYLVYAIADGTLYASAFDSSTGRVSGAPVIIATGVAIGGNNTAQFAAARNGTVVYIPEEPRSLVLIGRDGSIRPATPEKRNFHSPMFSPDGRRIALDFNAPDGRDVWLLNLADGLLSRATFDRDGHDAVWMPDGRALTYTSVRKGILTLMRTKPGESQPADVLLSSAQLGYGGVWMPDASALITVANSVDSGSDLAWVRGAGKGPIEPLLGSRFNEEFPSVSPDGRWLAFVSNQSGQNQVYVRSLTRRRRPGPGLAHRRDRTRLEPRRARALLPHRGGSRLGVHRREPGTGHRPRSESPAHAVSGDRHGDGHAASELGHLAGRPVVCDGALQSRHADHGDSAAAGARRKIAGGGALGAARVQHSRHIPSI